jgi:hypothetical protein
MNSAIVTIGDSGLPDVVAITATSGILAGSSVAVATCPVIAEPDAILLFGPGLGALGCYMGAMEKRIEGVADGCRACLAAVIFSLPL